jgi:polysaccharide export outer membrane protein
MYLLSGCITYRDIVNFRQGSAQLESIKDSVDRNVSLKLQADDIIQVFVSSYNKEEANKFNLLINQASAGQAMNAGPSVVDPFGYRIDQKGNIEMPLLGDVPVGGRTLEEARNLIAERINATNYLKDFNVHLRYLSFRVTVLGEVNSPGTYTIPSQRLNILEALGLAKDVTIYSKRKNILVVREENGKKSFGHIDLTSKDIFKNQWYHLKPNDVVYVQPHSAKILAVPDPASRYVSTGIALVSLVLLFLRL